jgi:exodeoxyribonuclease-3
MDTYESTPGRASSTPPCITLCMLRVLSYNILEGFQTFPERKKTAIEWIAAQKPDILALQEMNGYIAQTVAHEAKAWYHPHSVLLKDIDYSTALTSRTPISGEQRLLDGFQHGLLSAHTYGIDAYVVHLSPHDCEWRLRESRMIVARVSESMRVGRPVLVMGDFNSVSPADRDHYAAESDVLQHQLRGDREMNHSNTRNGELDFRVLQVFLDAGLVDVVAGKTTRAPDRLSFPTPLVSPHADSDEYRRSCLRLDYILASPELAKRCRRAEIIRGESTAMLSDHYPVLAEFD